MDLTRARKRKKKREKRQRWKAAKRERREALKRQYQDAPVLVRCWALYAKKPVTAVAVLALIAALCVSFVVPWAVDRFNEGVLDFYLSIKDKPVREEKILALSPLDEKGAKRIDKVEPVGKKDTWTICVYLVGSNLEDGDEDDLSSLTKLQIQDAKDEVSAESWDAFTGTLSAFEDTLGKNRLEMPDFFYYPEKPIASSTVVTEDVVVASEPGCASVDMGEMTSGTWSDNIRIVMQTGGAKRWSNQIVNPNRTQRFLYHKGKFSEIEDLALQPSYEPDTLADFVKYCDKEYPADHRMLILWDHGGGAFGYGNDSIIGGSMSLSDIRTALSKVYKPDRKAPAFDIIGFDACLMSSLEVVHALDGFADYYAVSEETEPGDGWDYGPWLQAMTDDPTMSPARVCQAIADSYTDYYMAENENVGFIFPTNDVTFSVLDAKQCSKLYDAYCDLAKAQLIKAAGDMSVLAQIGRCANQTTHYAASIYDVYNTIDLGGYVDLLSESFPKECARVKKHLAKAVMYHRENGSLADSQGISVYVPGSIRTFGGLDFFMTYLNSVVEDENIEALYHYRVGGCLSDAQKKYLATLTDDKPAVLNTKPFRKFSHIEPMIENNGFTLPLKKGLKDMLEGCELEVGVFDEEEKTVTYYGRDALAAPDERGNISCRFDGKWFTLQGQPLSVEVASSNDTATEYRSRVLYNNTPSYLVFSCEKETGDCTIKGICEIPDENVDGINYLIDTRAMTEVLAGSRITPIYSVSNYVTGELEEQQGKTMTFKRSSAIKRQSLPNDRYLGSVVISDIRGETYYSMVVDHVVSGGRVKERKVDEEFVGSNY